jgi:hypothetical protein
MGWDSDILLGRGLGDGGSVSNADAVKDSGRAAGALRNEGGNGGQSVTTFPSSRVYHSESDSGSDS